MAERKTLQNLGIYIYGLSAIVLGLIGLVWKDFATNWQRVQEGVPHREALAIITALYELVGGVVIFKTQLRR